MHKDLEGLAVALGVLATVVRNGWSGDQTFQEAWGWNCPALTRHDLARMAELLAEDIRSANAQTIPEALAPTISDFARRIAVLQANTVPQLWGGNNPQAFAAYEGTLSSMRRLLVPVIGWTTVPDNRTMPAQLARRLRNLQAEIDQIAPDRAELMQKVEAIRAAHDAAQDWPSDLQQLTETKRKVLEIEIAVSATAASVKKDGDNAAAMLRGITGYRDAADKLVEKCEEAYRITTSKGLAGAFDQRAAQLNQSMWIWILGLLAALAVAATLGASRIELLTNVASGSATNWGVVLLHLLLSVLSIGAPIWFAWLATKQIGQRFRLAEDYAFKASIAKAYEGYRKEAARIDAALEARLFASALTRLDEAPLRFIGDESHGSPWHELFSSPAFEKALAVVPELRDTLAGVAKTVSKSSKATAASLASALNGPKPPAA